MDHPALARSILDTVTYAVLSTADADGTPWATPVWFAHDRCHAYYWVSAPDTRHSRNLVARPEIALVVFDSTAAPNAGQAVYASGRAEQVADPSSLAHGLAVFSARTEVHGTGAWDASRVRAPARLRLYRADVDQVWILDPDSPVDERVTVAL
ncbi:pyridoxamine 5'-phosphate oxidase family protein [Serinibacter arcticus]|uniref:Pyridoxamine 5'-phosphate oxidase family protein n=1 Tax=Serinibacter arcticus TaxID=1655435 RepID=A0A2U1ZXY5_9MICO|nr:pyridoxamine 5'-phosphate oxidase family protein [Serinibacter arcticus]PWD51800.1 pyridoxamine 5'-phosphate oxidase family protein [Serinibacter arcticus]